MKIILPRSSILWQYLAVITVNLTNLCIGFGLGWTSSVLVKLRNDTNVVLSRPITEDEGSWIASIAFIPTILSVYPAAYLADRLGRKPTIIMGSVPQIISCFFCLFATEVWMILLGRVLVGISLSFLFTVIPIYSVEIASKEIRGALGTIFQIFCSLGVFLGLSIGPFVSYFTLNVIFTAMNVTLVMPLFFLPESPYVLYSKGKIEESKNVLLCLRQSKDEIEEDIIEYKQMNHGTKSTVKELIKNKVFLKTIGIVLILASGAQLSGFNIVQVYLQTILETAKTNVPPETASAVIGLLQFCAGFCTSTVTDKFGRKPIMICTFFGMALGLIFLGVFFKLQQNNYEITGILNILPIVSIILIVFCYSGGPGSILFVLIAELFEGPTRAFGVSMGIKISSLFVFITTKCFVFVISHIGTAMTFWLCSLNSVLIALFILLFVPETKGKSFMKIQEALGVKNVVDKNENC